MRKIKRFRHIASAVSGGVFVCIATQGLQAAEFYQTVTPGATGDIRAAELPPEPGFYAIGGLWGNRRDALLDRSGNRMYPDTEEDLLQGQLGGLFVYPGELLGGRLASSVVFAYGKHDLTVTNTLPVDLTEEQTGLFDAYSDLFFWSKSWYKGPPMGLQPGSDFIPPPVGFTFGFGLGITIPIGNFSGTTVGNPGFNNWVLSPNIAFTYRTAPLLLHGTEFSTRIFYNHNFDREDTTGGFSYRDGDYISADFAVTERFNQFQFGLAGNIKWQVEDDEGSLAVPAVDGQRHKSFRLGPLLAIDLPDKQGTVTLKYLADVYNRNSFEGGYLQLSFIRKLW